MLGMMLLDTKRVSGSVRTFERYGIYDTDPCLAALTMVMR